MANEQLVARAMEAFNRLDGVGKLVTAHALGAKTPNEVRAAFAAQDDWILERMTIEEMEEEIANYEPEDVDEQHADRCQGADGLPPGHPC